MSAALDLVSGNSAFTLTDNMAESGGKKTTKTFASNYTFWKGSTVKFAFKRSLLTPRENRSKHGFKIRAWCDFWHLLHRGCLLFIPVRVNQCESLLPVTVGKLFCISNSCLSSKVTQDNDSELLLLLLLQQRRHIISTITRPGNGQYSQRWSGWSRGKIDLPRQPRCSSL